jgi:UPF0755 protein
MDRFEKVADKMSYPQNLNSGRFITRNEQLWFGKSLNLPVSLIIRIENLAGRIGSQIEPIACPYWPLLKTPFFWKKMVLMKIMFLAVCIPNTYEIYWNTSADKFRDKMIKEYRKFWNKERVTKLRNKA